jgi:hypothetical protein
MPIPLTDSDLVLRIGSGPDRDAEAELCCRMGARIRLFGLRRLRDAQAADDLTQQVLVTAIEALRAGRLRDPQKLASFVLGTCRLTVLDLRRGARRRERLLEQFGPGLVAPVPPATPEVDHERLTRCVQPGAHQRDLPGVHHARQGPADELDGRASRHGRRRRRARAGRVHVLPHAVAAPRGADPMA